MQASPPTTHAFIHIAAESKCPFRSLSVPGCQLKVKLEQHAPRWHFPDRPNYIKLGGYSSQRQWENLEWGLSGCHSWDQNGAWQPSKHAASCYFQHTCFTQHHCMQASPPTTHTFIHIAAESKCPFRSLSVPGCQLKVKLEQHAPRWHFPDRPLDSAGWALRWGGTRCCLVIHLSGFFLDVVALWALLPVYLEVIWLLIGREDMALAGPFPSTSRDPAVRLLIGVLPDVDHWTHHVPHIAMIPQVVILREWIRGSRICWCTKSALHFMACLVPLDLFCVCIAEKIGRSHLGSQGAKRGLSKIAEHSYRIGMAAWMLHGLWFGEEAGARNLMFFRVKWLQSTMKGTASVRRLRLRSFCVRSVPPMCFAGMVVPVCVVWCVFWSCGCRSHWNGCVKVGWCRGCMRNTIVFCSWRS